MILLDTHIWIWWITQEHDRIGNSRLEILQSTEDSLTVSAVSVYELSVLVQRSRVVLTLSLDQWLVLATKKTDISVLPVTDSIAYRAGNLEAIHGDPIDRMIIATSLVHDIKLMSLDSVFPRYTELQNRLL